MSVQEQTSLYEREIEDKALEKALEARQSVKEERKDLNKRFRESDARVKALLEELELGTGAAVRIGRFLVSLKPVASRSVSFETDPTDRLQISLLDL